jgi:FkbM family methyltransferase
MFQFIENQALAQGRRGRMFRKLMFWILQVYDPIVHYSLHDKRIALNLSHQLPFTRKEYPTYSENLFRVGSFIRSNSGMLKMIDIGANIGDSYALAGSKSGDRFLLIEGSAEYVNLLAVNTKDDPAVTRVQALLTDRSFSGKGEMILTDGTARVGGDAAGAESVQYQTLDELVAKYPDFASANLVKSDVDGYDSKVLVGGEQLIRSASPVLFFEHHPHLLALAGDDDKYIFPILKKWGYSKLIFYDIKGFLFGLVDSDDSRRIEDLVFYAKSKGVLCYDVCCFHDTAAKARDRFLESEKQFYTRLIAERLQSIQR